MAYIVEEDFQSEEGYRCVVIFTDMGHRCGYVGIPKTHPLSGLDYGDKVPEKFCSLKEELLNRPFGETAPFIAMLCGEPDGIGVVLEVHGGITFAKSTEDYPVKTAESLWWFGFDANHCYDAKDMDAMLIYYPEREIDSFYLQMDDAQKVRTKEYMKEQCLLLARQLKRFEG